MVEQLRYTCLRFSFLGYRVMLLSLNSSNSLLLNSKIGIQCALKGLFRFFIYKSVCYILEHVQALKERDGANDPHTSIYLSYLNNIYILDIWIEALLSRLRNVQRLFLALGQYWTPYLKRVMK